MTRWHWAALTLFVGVSHAQLQERGLLAGHVLDSRTGTLRPVRGIPGAARLGDPLPLEAVIAEATVRNGRAIVISAEETPRLFLLRRLDAPAPEVIPLDSPIASVSRIYLNQSATTAFLYSSANHSAQFVTGLNGTPELSAPISSEAFLGEFLDAAVADTRSCALLTSFDEQNGYLQQVCASPVGQMGVIARLPGVRPAAVGWFRKEKDALIADAAGNQLLLLPDFATGSAPVTLAGPNDGIDNPAALTSLNGTAIAVMNHGSASLVLVDTRQGGEVRRIELPELATRLEFLDASAVLVCTRVGPGPLMLIDPRRDFAALYVPMN